MTTVLKWAYRYHRLEVDEFDSVNAAIDAARYAADSGSEALDCLEIVTQSGELRVVPAEEVWALAELREAALRSKPDERPVLIIEIVGPDGKPASEWWSNDLAATQERLAWWRGVVGADRVSLVTQP